MKRILILAAALTLGAAAFAQEPDVEKASGDQAWFNVTTLHYVAGNGEDDQHTLQQFLFIPESAYQEHPALFERLKTFSSEFMDYSVGQAVGQTGAMVDEKAAEIQQMIETYPEMAAELKKALEELERQRGEVDRIPVENKGFSDDPVDLLRQLTAIAVNRKAYTAYMDIGHGLFAVTEAPRYVKVQMNAFDREFIPQDSYYTWGVIDSKGRQIIPARYGRFTPDPDENFLMTYIWGPDEEPLFGVIDYAGSVLIPFIYEDVINRIGNCFALWKDGRIGIVRMGGEVVYPFEIQSFYTMVGGWAATRDGEHYGVLDQQGREVVPFKYEDFWSEDEKGFLMLRTDGKLDRFDNNYRFVQTEEIPEEEN